MSDGLLIMALEVGAVVVAAGAGWAWTLWRWPFRRSGRYRLGARAVDRVVRGRGRHRG